MDPDKAKHLSVRDRLAFRFRVAGTLGGLAFIAWAFARSNWESTWVYVVCGVVTVGGAVAYHVLTSFVRCPTCANHMVNLRISSAKTTTKRFLCGQCGTSAYLHEGFYWQRDWAG
jgi:predicted RNA-binding Zn-ribbon protein involved in translation (DUF1610 family)